MLERVAEFEDRRGSSTARPWNTLPQSFEIDAVRAVYKKIKPHFDKRHISNRIEASAATCFTDLRAAIEDAKKRPT
jgi:hypothetical protein